MASNLRKYFRFVSNRRPIYFNFNKQLMVGELAGFAGGLVAAEAAATLGGNEFGISLSSGIVDYVGSILGFLAIFYRDNSSHYRELARSDRFRKIMQNAFSLWPSVILA